MGPGRRNGGRYRCSLLVPHTFFSHVREAKPRRQYGPGKFVFVVGWVLEGNLKVEISDEIGRNFQAASVDGRAGYWGGL